MLQDRACASPPSLFTPASKNFITDQRQEVIRFLTGLAPRHPFRDKSAYDAAKEEAERTERLVELLNDEAKATRFGEAAKVIASAKFSQDAQLGSTIELYNSLLSK